MFCVKTKLIEDNDSKKLITDETKWITTALFENEGDASLFIDAYESSYDNMSAKYVEIDGDVAHFALISEQAFSKLNNISNIIPKPDIKLTSEQQNIIDLQNSLLEKSKNSRSGMEIK